MKKISLILSFIVVMVISGCSSTPSREITNVPSDNTSPIEGQNETQTENNNLTQTPGQSSESGPTEKPTPTPTPDPLGNLYDCEMTIEFTSGPLASESTSFTVLGEDYFTDRGDKFDVGKGTGIYYEPQHYFILHSSYIGGIINRALEAEFIRQYLELFGGAGPMTIQVNIDNLIGSKAVWSCEGGSSYVTEINGVIRLSHEASNRLWLEPLNIPQILEDREGLASEWVGAIDVNDDSRFLLGFCGWGPESLGEERYTYYRYLMSFDLIEIIP